MQWDESEFSQIGEIKKALDPYEKLWRTARDFDLKSKTWLNSPYWKVDANEVETLISDMYKTIHRLTKVLIDQPGPLKVAQKVRVSLTIHFFFILNSS